MLGFAIVFLCKLNAYRCHIAVQGGPKNRLFLRVDNFATVKDRKACDMSKVSIFCL